MVSAPERPALSQAAEPARTACPPRPLDPEDSWGLLGREFVRAFPAQVRWGWRKSAELLRESWEGIKPLEEVRARISELSASGVTDLHPSRLWATGPPGGESRVAGDVMAVMRRLKEEEGDEG